MPKKLTQEEVIQRMNKINPNIKIIGEYKGNNTKIRCECLVPNCGYIWSAVPRSLFQGSGCPKCANKYISESKKYSTEDFINLLSKINPNIKIMGDYIGNKIKIKCKCLIDGTEWYAQPNHLLEGHGCPQCSAKKLAISKRNTHDKFIQTLKLKNSNILVLGQYVDAKTKIKCRCLIDGYEWETTPNNLLNGTGCPMCGRIKNINSKKMTHEEFILKLNNINSNIIVIDKYIASSYKIKVKCKQCDCIWETTPNNLLRNHGCPKCNESKGEKLISQILTNHLIDYIQQYKFEDCKNIKSLPFDFYLPNYNICIEYDGEQHFKPIKYFGGQKAFQSQQQKDEIKNKYCQDNKIKLIRISYRDYENIEKILNKELF